MKEEKKPDLKKTEPEDEVNIPVPPQDPAVTGTQGKSVGIGNKDIDEDTKAFEAVMASL